MNYKFR